MDLTALNNTNQELLDMFAVVSGLVLVFFGSLLLGLGLIKILETSNKTTAALTVLLIVTSIFAYRQLML